MAKKLNTLGVVFMALAAVGLILTIIGMCTGVVSATFAGETDSTTLFDEYWSTLEQYGPYAEALGITVPSRTFPIIAFVVALIGALIVLVHGILGMIGKDIKIIGLVGGAVAIVGGILVVVAGFILAGQFNDVMVQLAGMKGLDATAGIGVWIGAIGAILAGVAGILGALKVGQKAE
ncbi:MAG: hypothetical protein K2M47_05245 [Clostridiales bacterium]|nr:hypothetical protein [Clostridiales bacterium]